MKSLNEITNNVTQSLSQMKPQAGSGAVSLPMRPTPLSPDEISKIQSAIDKHFSIKTDDSYGYVPVVQDGVTIREEFDTVGSVTRYITKKDVPAVLWETLLRPSPRSHVIYHLGRLAAHRRNTRGAEAFQVIMEDIASDLGSISEWAMVMACAEMRQKNDAWFPNTGEIIAVVKKYAVMLDNLYLKRLESDKPANDTKPKVKRMDKYFSGPKANPMRPVVCDFLVAHGEPDHFDNDRLYSNYYLEGIAKSKYGWEGSTEGNKNEEAVAWTGTFGDGHPTAT